MFVRLIEAGVRPKRDPDKSFPLDSALMAALESYEVSFLLLHESASKPPKRPNPPRIPNSPPKRPRTGKGTGKGQQKHTSASSGARIPKAMLDLGGTSHTPEGAECCYGFNLGKCSVKGCTRKHVCCKCFGSHPISECKT